MTKTSRNRVRPFADHYAVLGVTLRSGPAELQRAYRAAAKKYHPDAGGDPSGRTIRAVNEAYAVLRDPAKRRAYDLAWVAHEVDPRGVRRDRKRRHRGSRTQRAVFRFARATGVAACLVIAVVLFAAAVAGAGSRSERMGSGKVDPAPRVEELAAAAQMPFEYAVPFESEGECAVTAGDADKTDRDE